MNKNDFIASSSSSLQGQEEARVRESSKVDALRSGKSTLSQLSNEMKNPIIVLIVAFNETHTALIFDYF
jgi:hypothetical protein